MIRRMQALCLTKFFSNFNDNAFKSVAILVVVKLVVDDAMETALIAFGSMIFMLPFITFPTVAGWLGDRYPKRNILVSFKGVELVVMCYGAMCLINYPEWGQWPLFGAIFCMALQSTFFSPAFLGYLPEAFDEKDLSSANGVLELVAFLGTILGCGMGAMVAFVETGTVLIGVPFVVISILGLSASFFIPHTDAPLSNERFGIHLFLNYFKSFRYIAVSRPIFLCVIGHALFFAMGAILLPSLVAFGRQELDLGETAIAALQVVSALGIGIGCFVAGKVSGEKVEFGLVPIGSLGMSIFCVCLTFSDHFVTALLSNLGIGFFGGLYLLPILVYIQDRADPRVRGKTLAMMNAVAFLAMFMSSLAMLMLTGGYTGELTQDMDFWTRVRTNFLTMSIRDFYAIIGVCMMMVTCAAFYILPDFLFRMIMLVATKIVYRLRVFGRDNLPESGPAMLVANHVSLVDGLLISAAALRPIHFIFHLPPPRNALLRAVARWARFHFVPRPGDDSAAWRETVARAHEILGKGETLCVFPEGKLTSNGMMGRFQREFMELIPDDADVPVIPVYLGLLWGSIFSLRYGDIKPRRPQHLPFPVIISFGSAVSRDISPARLRLALSELSSDAERHPAKGEVGLAMGAVAMARRHPLRKQFHDSDGTSISNISLLIRSFALAAEIRRVTVPSERYVGLLMPTSAHSVVVGLAVMLADRIPVFLNFTASREALAHAMNQCGMSRVWTVRPFMEKIGLELDCETVYIDEWCKTISATDRLRAVAAACLMKKETIRGRFLRESSRSLDNTATVLFSSGSTGVPKGVVLSHHNLNANLNGVIRVLCLERRDVIMGILPFFHSFGFLATFWLPVKCGVKVVYHSNPVDADAIGEMVQRHRATILFSTPTFLQAYIRKCTREQFASLRLIITGAEKLRTAIAQKFTEKFGPFPVEGYGCTELSPVVSVNVPLLGQDAGKLCGREGSVGQPMPGVTVKTVSPDSGEILDEEEEGLLLIKGPNVMQGYLEDPDRTAEVLKDGWYNTGDIGKIDRDGYIFITGRLSRFSKIAGEMIPHGAVEEEIHSVLDCKETLAVVTSVSDEKKGEKLVVLHLPLEKSVDDIISGLREKGLPNLWIPKVRDFHEIEEIPVLGTGKLDLKKVSELAKKLAQ